MTHEDIYKKFLIQYDKANVTSSYPALTKYEVVTLLNKAYLALISQKVSGNNFRHSQFEEDTKAIEDIRPLIITEQFGIKGKSDIIQNSIDYYIHPDMMYFISARLERKNVKLINHSIAEKYKQSDINYPWIPTPVCYLENDLLHVLVDPKYDIETPSLNCTFVKKPTLFTVESVSEIEDEDRIVDVKYDVQDTSLSVSGLLAIQTRYVFNTIGIKTITFNTGKVYKTTEDIEIVATFKQNTSSTKVRREGVEYWNNIPIYWSCIQNEKPNINPSDEPDNLCTVIIGPSNNLGSVKCFNTDTIYTDIQTIKVKKNTVLELSAIPIDDEHILKSWSNGETDEKLLFIVTEDTSCIADFAKEYSSILYQLDTHAVDLPQVEWNITSCDFSVGVTITKFKYDNSVIILHEEVWFNVTFDQNTSPNEVQRSGVVEAYEQQITWRVTQLSKTIICCTYLVQYNTTPDGPLEWYSLWVIAKANKPLQSDVTINAFANVQSGDPTDGQYWAKRPIQAVMRQGTDKVRFANVPSVVDESNAWVLNRYGYHPSTGGYNIPSFDYAYTNLNFSNVTCSDPNVDIITDFRDHIAYKDTNWVPYTGSKNYENLDNIFKNR